MKPGPRLRQACPPGRGGIGSVGGDPAPVEPLLPDPNDEANVVLLSGTIVEEPIRDRTRNGDPVTVLLVAFPAPDEEARRSSVCCEIEVPDEIANRKRQHLRAGRRLVVLGKLTGAGGIWSTAIDLDDGPSPPAGR